MRKYQRATKNELDTFLLRNNKLLSQPELFNEIYDDDGNIVDLKKVKRANELTGAGIEYTTSFVEYICTHYKEDVEDAGRLYYTAGTWEWAAFLDIVTGRITGQRERAERAILQLHANPKPVLMFSSDGHLHSRIPFVFDFDWGRPETLDAKAAARLARLNQRGDDRERLPIKTISVMFAKPLFEDFFRKGAGTYSFPTGMYAKMFKEANDMKKSLVKDREELKTMGHELTDEDTDLDQEKHVSAYARFARYIIRHNNLTGKQQKDKTHYSTLTRDIVPFLSEVYPSALHKNSRKERHVNWQECTSFLSRAMAFYRSIPNFILYPVLEHIDSTTFRLGIYTSMKAADEADKKKNTPLIEVKTAATRTAEIKAFKAAHPAMSNRMMAQVLECSEITIRRALKQD